MAIVIKLKDGEDVFEVGKDDVKDIRINEEHTLVEIEFEDRSEWDKKLISIHNIGSIDLKEEHLNIDPFAIR